MSAETLAQELTQRLQALEPESLLLDDNSAAHAGHAGNQGGGHFDLVIVSPRFEGVRQLERQRMIYALVGDLMPHRLHALAIRAYAPSEA